MERISSLDQQASLVIPAFVEHWAREMLGGNSIINKLRGGINNQVYVCSKGGHKFVIKGYPAKASSKHDRMRAETDFLEFAQHLAPNYVPGLIAQDSERRCIVLDYIEGAPYKEGEKLSESDVNCAISFIRALNQNKSVTNNFEMQQAADGFTRISDHIENVQNRIEALKVDHLPKHFQLLAIEALDKLKTRWERVKLETENSLARGDVVNVLSEKYQCYSPSDFGFHNAIKTADGVKFIDFEFAGKDDPAKTVSDFFLQPRIPVKQQYISKLINAFQDRINKSDLEKRTRILSGVLKIKWMSIILAILNPKRFDGLLHTAEMDNDSNFVMNRLKLANAYLLMENPFGLH
jgi:thiamine kinase-like enzyme